MGHELPELMRAVQLDRHDADLDTAIDNLTVVSKPLRRPVSLCAVSTVASDPFLRRQLWPLCLRRWSDSSRGFRMYCSVRLHTRV
jgi:hypothetical protein